MAYDNNVPLATQTIAATQQPIHDNYADIETLLLVNHVGFNVANQGKHKVVTMPVQAATPVPLASEINMFSRTSAFTARPEVCIARSTGEVIELSADFNNGWAFTASGLLIKWGTANVPSVATNVVYPAAANIPVFGAVLNVMITTAYPTGLDENKNVTLIQFNNVLHFSVVGTQRTATAPYVGNATIYYMALGRL
jgi:hypothetical protein